MITPPPPPKKVKQQNIMHIFCHGRGYEEKSNLAKLYITGEANTCILSNFKIAVSLYSACHKGV